MSRPVSKTLPSSSYIKRSKPRKDGNKDRLSHSAMSSRTFSRVQQDNFKENDDLQKSLTFLDDNGNESEENEEQYEEELLARLMEQQQQLKELQSRQQKLLSLQQNLAKLDENADNSMAQKLNKLQSARTRIDQLQGLVDNIKSAEQSNQSTDNVPSTSERQQIVDALGQLNDLKNLVETLSSGVNNREYPSSPSSMSSLKPIFSDHVSMVNTTPGKGAHKLPEVTIVKHTHEEQKDTTYYQQPVDTPTQIEQVEENTPQELQLTENSKELLKEVQRHQILLKELQERRDELDRVMKETEQLKADTNALNNTNSGSVSIKVENTDADFSMNDPCDFETSDSGRLFGLNESATKRLIDIIRAQKNLDANVNTEKTTATWGSSDESSESSEEDEEDQEESDSSGDEAEEEEQDVNDTLALAHEKRPSSNQHEIDFRPPTRRQDVASQQPMFSSYEEWKENLEVLQDDLSSAEITMQLLLEDQQALQRLLHNSLNIQNNSFSSKVCYGISPDFLIYQVDNCFNQVITLQNEMRSMQWKLYKVMGNPPTPTATKSPSRSRGDFKIHSVKAVRSNPHTPEKSPRKVVARASKTAPNLAYYDKYARDSPRSNTRVVQKKMPKKQPTRKLAKPRPKLDDSCELEYLDSQSEMKSVSSKDKHNLTDMDLFESLRDSIYSEAAILISQNEARPHFLMELFHCLQQMDSDFLRQQCLYNIQDILKGYITRNQENQPKNTEKQETSNKKKTKAPRSMSYSENTPSESAVTSDDEIYAKLRAKVAKENSYDYSLKISSASEVSSPSDDEEQPFASEDLGSTVIHLDAALRHMREMERIKQEQENTSANSSARSQTTLMGGDASNLQSVSLIDSKELNSTIKKVISDVIPLLKQERENLVDIKFLAILQSIVIESILREVKKSDEAKSKGKNASLEMFFTKQLKTILSKSMLKFVSQRVGSCGEELVLSMSEVLFNELAFYFMMQDMERGEAISIPVEKESEDTGNVNMQSTLQNGDDNEERQKEDDDIETEVAVQKAIVENEQVYDDGKVPVTVDLSVSETKPLTSYGSGEDEDEGSGDEYTYNDVDVPTSVQHEQQNTTDQNSPKKTEEPAQDEKEEQNNKDEKQPLPTQQTEK